MRPWCKRPPIGAIRCCSDGKNDRNVYKKPNTNNNRSQLSHEFGSNRRLSIVGLGLLPFAGGLGEEARMWKEEAGFYSRKIQNALINISGADSVSGSGKVYPKRPLDAEFGMVLLKLWTRLLCNEKRNM